MGKDSSPDVAASELEDDPSVTAEADEPAITRERAPDVQPGDVLAGRYQIEAVIGKGGSGVVLRAFDRVSATVVAVKVLKPGLTHDPRWEKRFQRELRLGRPIRHPNVCRIFDIGDADGYRFLTMEYATGGTLRGLIKKNQPLRPLPERLADAAGAIAGLAAIHSAGIVHRDVKPDNMLRMEDGRLVLSDFGLATDLPDSTMVSVFVGTPHYMAPEVREGDPATTRSDVWSLGVVLHEIFFGRRPDRRSSRSGASSSLDPMTKASSKVERAMLVLCERCLANEPADRPPDGGAVQALFETACSSPSAALRIARKSRLPFVAIGVVTVAVVSLALAYALGGNRAKVMVPKVDVTGEPADWTKTASDLATIPGSIDCFSRANERVVRVIWGRPRRAEDIDLASGERIPSPLRPEMYAFGCPDVSPRGQGVLFTAQNAAGVTEIRLASGTDGTDARTITPGSDPLWLTTGEEFVYNIDASHVAIFSLPTMTFSLLRDPGSGGRPMISEKAISPKGNAVALLLLNDDATWALSTFEGNALESHRTFLIAPARSLRFTLSGTRVLVPTSGSRASSTLLSVDWHNGTARRIGRYAGLELMNVSAAGGDPVIVGRRRLKDVWLHAQDGPKRLTFDGENFSAAVSRTGELLVSKRSESGEFAIWRQPVNGGITRLTDGPNDVDPEFGPDSRTWAYVDYLRKRLVMCSPAGGCKPLREDEMLPVWPRFSPDGEMIAYVTETKAPHLMVVSTRSGTAWQVGPAHWECPPVWSSAATLWALEGSAGRYFWSERDALSGKKTGRRVDLKEDPAEAGCANADQIDSPFFQKVQIRTDETSYILRLPPQDWEH